MSNKIIHFLVSALAVFLAAKLVPGAHIGILGALLGALVLGFINLFIKPVITLFTLPITVVTLGLFSLVINALLVLLAAEVVPGFSVSGFWSALLFSLVLSFINAFFGLNRRD